MTNIATHSQLSRALSACLCILALTTNAQTIRYVKPGAASIGLSWEFASGDLAQMLRLSNPGDEVWVAAGTYLPLRDPTGNTAPSDPRTKTFVVKSGVKVYGGFVGTETSLSQRPTVNPATNPSSTTLSGDMGIPAGSADDLYHVVIISNATAQTRLDGFVITGGHASPASSTTLPLAANGGGILLYNTTGINVATISNCLLANNHAYDYGGGVYVGSNCAPVFWNCFFYANSCSGGIHTNTGKGGGGGMAILGQNNITSVNSCFFSRNVTYGFGGGVYAEGSTQPQTEAHLVFVNTVFSRNATVTSSPQNAGGLYINGYKGYDTTDPFFDYDDSYISVGLINCTFNNNCYYSGSCSNAIFHGVSYSVVNGVQQFDPTGTVTIKNCIIRDPNSLTSVFTGAMSITYSNIEGCNNATPCQTGAGNVDYPVHFLNPDTDQLYLLPGNVGIDFGDPDSTTASVSILDIAGQSRVQNDRIDMGAYETLPPIQSVRADSWNNPGTWSCSCVPTGISTVTVRHLITIPDSFTARAFRLRYTVTGRLLVQPSARLQLGKPD